MSASEKGDRVRFLGFGEPDPYSRLRVGTEGTVATVDDLGTVHVDWDDGSGLGMGSSYRPPAGYLIGSSSSDRDPTATLSRPCVRCPPTRSPCALLPS